MAKEDKKEQKRPNKDQKKKQQAGAELCQAQVKLGLAKIEIILYLLENWGRLQLELWVGLLSLTW